MAGEMDQCLGGQALVASINRDFKGMSVISSAVGRCQQGK
jgi:hypothetical protein